MRFAALLVPIGLCCCVQPITAQTALPIGQRVRFTSERHGMQGMVGNVVSVSHDSVTIGLDQRARRDTVSLALTDLDRLELGHDGGHHTRRGTAIGLATGSVIGFLVGAMTYEECMPQGLFDCLGRPTSEAGQGVLGATVGGAVGGLVGLVVGASTRSEEWEDVSIRPLQAGRMGLGLTIHF